MTPTDPKANMERKRKRISSADDGLDLQLGGDGVVATEQVMVKEETEDPPEDTGNEGVASSTVSFAADFATERNATTGHQKMKLKKEMEDELQKVKQEEIRFQMGQLYIGGAYRNLLQNKARADKWAAMNRSSPSERRSISASGSSEVPRSTVQLLHAGTPLRYPNQAPHSATSASTPPRCRPSAGTSLARPAPAPGFVLRAPAPHLRSRLPVTPGTSTTGPVLSASPASLTFGPSAGTLSHPVPGHCLSAMGSTCNPADEPVRGIVPDSNDASSSGTNGSGTASDAGRRMVNENGVIYLSDDV